MSSNKSLTDRTEAVYRELRSMRRRFRLSAWITLIVGGLLLLLVVFYFTYGYHEIARLRDPDLIVSLIGQTVDTQIPTLRQNLEAQVKQNASTWAEQASEHALAAIPDVRKQIESLALQQSDAVIAKIDMVGEDKFRKILNDNRAAVQKTIDQLKSGGTASEDLVLTLQDAIEQELQIDSENQAEALLTFVSDLNASMEKLQTAEKLSREQRAERRALILARTLQLKHFGDIKAEHLAAAMPAVAEFAEDAEAKRLKEKAKEATAAEAAESAPAKDEGTEKPAAKPEEMPKAEEKPAAKPEEMPKAEEKPAAKPEEKAKAEEKPAAKPEEKPKAEEKPAAKPEEKPKAEEKPAAKPEEAAKPAEKVE
jgi:hypothetical protein